MIIACVLFILSLRFEAVRPAGLLNNQGWTWGPWWSKDLNTSCVFTRQPCEEFDCSGPKPPIILKTINCDSWEFVMYGQQTVKIVFPEGSILTSNFDMIAKFVTTGPVRMPGVLLNGFKGIDLDFFAPLRLNDLAEYSSLTYLTWFIHDSQFDLYHHGEHILTPVKCNSQTYQALINVNNPVNVLQVFGSITFFYARVKFKICQFMFQNISLDMLHLEGYSFEFSETCLNGTKLNSSINNLRFMQINNLELSTKVLDPEVFGNTTSVELKRVILFSIQADLFKDRFYMLSQIFFDIYNKQAFFHDWHGVEWTKYLNNHIDALDLDNQTLVLDRVNYIKQKSLKVYINLIYTDTFIINSSELFPYFFYYFPNEDFCLFHDFPVQRLVFLQLWDIRNVTCTIAWLYRYMNYYSSIGLDGIDSSLTMPKCNFSQLIESCHLTNSSSFQYDPYITWYEWGRSVYDLKVVLIDHAKPIACVICLISNILIVLTILFNHKRRHEISSQMKSKDQEIVLLEQSLYKYILLNSILNSIYSLTTLIDYLIPCTPIRNVYYVYPLPDDCKPKAVFFDALASILKLMSNFSFLQISINRFILVGKDHPEWIVKTSQITVKKFFFYSLIVSFILSSSSYFDISFFSMSPDVKNLNTYDGYNHIASNIQERTQGLVLLSALTIIHDLFSYFLFCLISLAIDVMTVKKLHEALVEKDKLKGKSEEKRSRDSERRSIVMVVTNSLVNFILRAPELISVIFYYSVINSSGLFIRTFCFNYSDCLAILDFAKVFYILSLCFNICVLVKFNSVFRCSFLFMIRSVFKYLITTPTSKT